MIYVLMCWSGEYDEYNTVPVHAFRYKYQMDAELETLEELAKSVKKTNKYCTEKFSAFDPISEPFGFYSKQVLLEE